MDESEKDHGYKCEDCGHYEEDKDGNTRLVGVKIRETKRKGNARLLARTHKARTGHDPVVF